MGRTLSTQPYICFISEERNATQLKQVQPPDFGVTCGLYFSRPRLTSVTHAVHEGHEPLQAGGRLLLAALRQEVLAETRNHALPTQQTFSEHGLCTLLSALERRPGRNPESYNRLSEVNTDKGGLHAREVRTSTPLKH